MSVYATKYSSFLYGFEITDANNKIDFDEGTGALLAEIEPGNYSFGTFADAIEEALNFAGLNTYTVTVSRTTRKITIGATGATDFLFASGSNNGSSAAVEMGYTESDRTNVTSLTSDTAIGTVYTTQFKLQSYVPTVNSEMAAFSTRNKSASGRVQVQRFGVERFMKCEIMFVTDIPQSSASPIRNNASGVSDLQSFMSALCRQVPVEFYVDKDVLTDYETLILESSAESKEGTGFELKEMRAYRLRGYFETGKLTFRVSEIEES